VKLLPLYQHGCVVAFAQLDDDDYERVERFRWYLTPKGYAWSLLQEPGVSWGRLKGKKWQMLHREVMGLKPGDSRRIDHKNQDKLDCRKSNLRYATKAQNQQNVGARRDSKSRYRGAIYHRQSGRWNARVTLNGKTHSLGYHDTDEEAGRVAAEFRRVHMPFSPEAMDAAA
jgi:hypothetical protein